MPESERDDNYHYIYEKLITMQKTILTLISTLLIAVSSISAQATKAYCNNRFGFCVHYPAELEVSEERPTNGDGLVLLAPNGVQAAVSGSYNVMDWAPEKIFEFTTEDFAGIIGAEAATEEVEFTDRGFAAMLSAGTYYQFALMQSKGDVYLVLTITGPEESLEEIKKLRGQLKLTFDNSVGGR